MACAHELHSAQPSAGGRLAAACAISLVVMAVELVGGRLSHSLSLLADAGHIASDVLSLGVALAAHRVGRWPPKGRFTYGFRRWESLAAAFNGLTLVVVAALLAAGAVGRLGQPGQPVDAATMLGAGGLSCAGSLLNAVILGRHAPDDVNTRGAFLHVMTDLVCALGVVVGAVVVKLTGWGWVDLVGGLGIALLVGGTGLRLVARTGAVLAQAAPSDLAVEQARALLAAVPGVRRVERLRLWTVTPGQQVLTAVLAAGAPGRQQEVLAAARAVLGGTYPRTELTLEVTAAAPAAAEAGP